MFQRLLVPLAFRSVVLSVGIAGLTSLFLVAPVGLLRGEDGVSVTLRDVSAGVSWSGRAVGSNSVFDPSTCRRSQTCDVFTVNVAVSDDYRQRNPNFGLSVRLAWEDSQTDFDLYLTREGRTIKDSRQVQTNSEELRLDRPLNGIYDVYVQTASAAGATKAYNGRARLVAAPIAPAKRSARYIKDPDGKYGPEMFQFAPEQMLDRGGAGEHRYRTDIEIDPFGNAYVSSDGSDIALGDPQQTLGKLYSRPQPQWAAASGGASVYVASMEDSRLMVRRSDDGGRTYKQEAVLTRFPNGTAAAGQGNLVIDGTGTLFNVFAGTARNEIYLAKCVEPCERFMTRRIFAEPGVTVDHPYPVAATDRARGLHVAFSEGRHVFLMSSPDGGLTWKEPVPVNNPQDPETELATSPWIFAGDSGRVGMTWLGRGGEVLYAFTSDAFASAPVFNYVRISDPQESPNLPSAAVDPFGNSNIVYGNTYLLQQIAGERLFFGPFMTVAGTLQTETGMKRVSFNVRQDLTGSLTFLDEERRLSLRSARFTASQRGDRKIAVSGRGRLQDGSEVSFTLVASDPKANEKDFSISMSNGYFAAGVLQSTPSVAAKMLKPNKRSQ
jgi:hypothetical protein